MLIFSLISMTLIYGSTFTKTNCHTWAFMTKDTNALGVCYARLSEENKFVLNFYFRAVNELSIESGMLKSFVDSLGMGMEERMRFMRKLNMIHVTVHNIDYLKQEEKRNRARR